MKFAQRAKKIKNKAISNVFVTNSIINKLLEKSLRTRTVDFEAQTGSLST